MDENVLAYRFHDERPRLSAMAFRMLGSVEDAEDAIQRAWFKTARSDIDDLANLSGWLTTVVSRECLDMMRSRRRRNESPLHDEMATALGGVAPSAEEEIIRLESVSRALLVVLEKLSPAQRVAFVLHDVFAVPFEDIGTILDRTPTAAKKLASKARLRVGPRDYEVDADATRADVELVEAFLGAARDGDIITLLKVLAPDVIRRADPSLVPAGVPIEIRGARAVAEETSLFAPRVRVGAVVLIDEAPGIVIAPGGRLLALLCVTIRARQIHEVRLLDAATSSTRRITLANNAF